MNLSRRNFISASAALAASQNLARPAASDRIAVGFVGTGARGQELMQAVAQHPRAEMVAICDAYKGRVERALDRTGKRAKVYKNHHWHKQIVLEAIRAGKDVYCEKPLTYRTSDGVEIIQAARTKERMVQVGSQGVSSGIGIKAKEMIQAGKLRSASMST